MTGSWQALSHFPCFHFTLKFASILKVLDSKLCISKAFLFQEAKGRIEEAGVRVLSQYPRSLWRGMHIEFFFFLLETLTLATLNKSISKHGPFILQTFTYLPYAQCKTRSWPTGASHPRGNICLVNKKCHKALQICIGWQMLEPDHPHIWKKYGLQHFLSNVFPRNSVKVLSMLGTRGMMRCPQTCRGRSSLQLGQSLSRCSNKAGDCVDHPAQSLRVSRGGDISLCESRYTKGQRRIHQLVSKRE